MKILKKNQIIISILALMLITVGYISFTSNSKNTLQTANLIDSEKMVGIGDAKLVNSSSIEEESSSSFAENNENSNETGTIVDNDNIVEGNTEGGDYSSMMNDNLNTTNTGISSVSETKQTSASTVNNTDYFVTSRLERDKMYSQMLESYQNLAESTAVSVDQKNICTQEITNINTKKNAIMIAENLIKNLGFDDVVIFINDNSISIVVRADELSDADVAQVQNIVCREIGVQVENIHISLK